MQNLILIFSLILFLVTLYMFTSRSLYKEDFKVNTLGSKGKKKYLDNLNTVYIKILIRQQIIASIGMFFSGSLILFLLFSTIFEWKYFEGSWADVKLITSSSVGIFNASIFGYLYFKIDKRLSGFISKKIESSN